MTDKNGIYLEFPTPHRVHYIAILCGLMITGSATGDMECGGSLGKIIFKQQIENAQSEWGKLDQDIKSCVLKKINLTTDELAGRCIGPDHSKIYQEMSLCRKTAEQARKAREAKARQLAADKKAQEEAHQKAVASAEARRRELTEKYGEETAKHILSGNAVKGMTSEQVIEAVGTPLNKESIPPNFELWFYRDIKIAFSEGVVTHVDK